MQQWTNDMEAATMELLSVVKEDGTIEPLKEEPPTLDPFLSRKTVFKGHTDAIKDLCVDTQASRVYAASWDETVGVWNIPTRQLIGVLPHGCWINAVTLAFGKGLARLVVTGSEDGKVSFWSTNDLLIVYQVQPTHGPITHLYFYKDTVFAASGATVYAISAATGTVVREYKETAKPAAGGTEAAAPAEVTSLTAHDDQVYMGLEDGRIIVREIVGGFILRELFAHNKPGLCVSSAPQHVASVRALLINAATNTLYSGGDDGIVKAWTISTGACTRTIPLHRHGVYCLQLHFRDGDHFLYSGSSDGTIKVTRLSLMQTATLIPFTPYCMAIIGGADSNRNQAGPSSRMYASQRGSGGDNLMQSMLASSGRGDPGSPTGHRPVVREALLVWGDFSGTIEITEVEKFEDNLKFLPPNTVLGGSEDGDKGGGISLGKPKDKIEKRRSSGAGQTRRSSQSSGKTK